MQSIRLWGKFQCFCLIDFLTLARTETLRRFPQRRRIFQRDLNIPQRFILVITQELRDLALLFLPKLFHFVELKTRILSGWLQNIIEGNLVHHKPDVAGTGNLFFEDLLAQYYVLMLLSVVLFYLYLSGGTFFQNGLKNARLFL